MKRTMRLAGDLHGFLQGRGGFQAFSGKRSGLDLLAFNPP
jgi:hypothetical protein